MQAYISLRHPVMLFLDIVNCHTVIANPFLLSTSFFFSNHQCLLSTCVSCTALLSLVMGGGGGGSVSLGVGEVGGDGSALAKARVRPLGL